MDEREHAWKGSRGDSVGKNPSKANTHASDDQFFSDGYRTLDKDHGFGRRGLNTRVEYTEFHNTRRP